MLQNAWMRSKVLIEKPLQPELCPEMFGQKDNQEVWFQHMTYLSVKDGPTIAPESG